MQDVLDEITGIVNSFAQDKLSAQALDIKGPVQEGSNYRWSISSTRFKEVTVLAATKKAFLGKRSLSGLEIHGLEGKRDLKPDVADLREFMETAELIPVR